MRGAQDMGLSRKPTSSFGIEADLSAKSPFLSKERTSTVRSRDVGRQNAVLPRSEYRHQSYSGVAVLSIALVYAER